MCAFSKETESESGSEQSAQCVLVLSAANVFQIVVLSFGESSIDLAGVNNWLGLQAVMFGLIAKHWWSQAVIFLHIPL